MRKRILTLLVCGIITVAGLCGCNSAKQPEVTPTPEATATPAATATPTVTPTPELTIADISPMELVADMKIGWNVGNSLDATGGTGIMSETSWGNPKTKQAMIDDILNAGFNVIRIPITWDGHCGAAPEYKIHDMWLNRVKEVVDYAYNKGAYVIINTHHEEWYMPDEANKVANGEQLVAIWTQIAEAFKDYDEHLIFEGLNEPRLRGTSKEWTGDDKASEIINYWERLFVDAVRATGGNNTLRHLMITGYAASSSRSNLVKMRFPADDKLIVSVHAYTPYDFALNTTGTAKWSAKSNGAELDNFMKMLDELFISKGYPVIIGEFGAVDKDNLETRIEWADYYLRAAEKYGVKCVWWDNNSFTSGEKLGIYDRRNMNFPYPELVDAMMNVIYPDGVPAAE